MKKTLIILLLGLVFYLPAYVCAETIILKSGEKIEEKILERTGEYIRVEQYGMPITYFLDDIESIDGENLFSVSDEEKYPSKDITPATATQIKSTNQIIDTKYNIYEEFYKEGEYYNNKYYAVRLWYPKGWQVFDKDINPEIFKTILEVSRTPGKPKANIACVIAQGTDINNLDPIIMLIINLAPRTIRGLSTEDLVQLTRQDLNKASESTNISIIEYPTVIMLNNREFMRYTITAPIGAGISQIHRFYSFVEEGRVYFIDCITKLEDFDKYNFVFQKIAENIDVSGYRELKQRIDKFPPIILPIVALLVIFYYIFFAYCLQTIALKTGASYPGWFAWIPILNTILWFNIAKRPWWWIFLFLLGGIPVIGQFIALAITFIVWIDIAKACNKSILYGILLVIPVVQLFVLWRLAFSK